MEIDITKEIERFHQFLNIENNENIIFSGIFGIGKSYFIDKYFNHSYKEDYIPIYLTPVNYSVANNEDIFEYIKVDILMQLLQKTPCEFRDEKINFSVGAYFYLKNNAIDLLSSIATMAEKVKFGTDIISKLIKLKSNIDQFITDNSKNEEKETLDFINAMSFQKGSIYENNAITQIIQSLIKNAKSNDQPAKEIVLVIDDLDRIDPEHIFRILNILSAHNNFCGTDENKFEFDKTILVCDALNIRNIYKSKYGIDVDFNGYIDKFYSKEIYHFDNTESITKKISDILATTIGTEADLIKKESLISSYACQSIISALVKNGSMNVRSLLKINKKNINNQRAIMTKNKMTLYAHEVPCIAILDFIMSMYGSKIEVDKYLSELKNSCFDKSNLDHILKIFIILADYNTNNLNLGEYLCNDIKYTIEKPNEISSFIANIHIEPSDYIDVAIIIKKAYTNYKQYFI
ncbi:MAG: P-loop NTPase fold protein [Bacilli bacterium]